MLDPLPSLVVHADWSAHSAKRWMAVAARQPDGRYYAAAPQQVGELSRFLTSLRLSQDPSGCLLAGFDFPIGLPLRYAEMCGITSFPEWLLQAGTGEWADFFSPAAIPDEIHLKRPFYPLKPGHARQAHLLAGLGMSSINQLRRRCELPHPGRRAAAPLFWTLGGQQVGKAAISGWREVLRPALARAASEHPVRAEQGRLEAGKVFIWPFSGRLQSLMAPGAATLAETYPAEFYSHLGVAFPLADPAARAGKKGPRTGKRSQASRLANAEKLVGWAGAAGVRLEPGLQAAIREGFGPSPAGEDPFDAVVGLFGMLNVLLGLHPLYEPPAGPLRKIEGWIFGQEMAAWMM